MAAECCSEALAREHEAQAEIMENKSPSSGVEIPLLLSLEPLVGGCCFFNLWAGHRYHISLFQDAGFFQKLLNVRF